MSDTVKEARKLAQELRSLAEEHYEMLGDIHIPLGRAADLIDRLITPNESSLAEEIDLLTGSLARGKG